MAQVITCPYCGKLTDPKLDSCPHCGGIVPHTATSARPVSGQDLIGAPARPASVEQRCPNCGRSVQSSDIVCVSCGTNLLTGQKMTLEEQSIVRRRGAPLWLGIGAAVVVVALLAIVGAVYWLTRDPVGRASSKAASGDLQQAANDLTSYVAKHASDGRALVVLGKVQWKLNQLPNAAQNFEAAVKIDPGNTEAAMLGALCLADVQGARERQTALLRAVLKADPKNVDALRLLALATEEPAARVEALRRAVEVDPSLQAALAIAAALQGNGELAAAELIKAGDDTTAVTAGGFIAGLGGNAEAALDKFKAAATGPEPDLRAKTRYGMLLTASGQYEEARKHLTEAMGADKNNATARFYYAICLQAAGIPADAAREFEGAAQTAQGQSALAANAWLCAGDMYVSAGNAPKAQECLERATKAGMNSAAFYTAKARQASMTGDTGGAREALRKAMQLDAKYPAAYLESGLLYVKQQMFTEGVADLERFLTMVGPVKPGSPLDSVAVLLEHLRQVAAPQGAPPAATASPPPAPPGPPVIGPSHHSKKQENVPVAPQTGGQK